MEKAPTNTTSPEHGHEMSAEDRLLSERERVERDGDDAELAFGDTSVADDENEESEDYDKAKSDREFDENLTERLVQTSDFLENISDYIATDEMALAWFELSEAVKGAETVSDRMRKFDAVMEIEKAARQLGDRIRAGEGRGESREYALAA